MKDRVKRIYKFLSPSKEIDLIKKETANIYKLINRLQQDSISISKNLDKMLVDLKTCNQASFYNEAISNATNCMIWNVGLNNKIITMNDNMRITMGYFRSLKGKRLDNVIKTYKDNVDSNDVNILEDLFITNTKELIEEDKSLTMISRGKFFGEYKILRIRKNLIHNNSGTVIGVCGIADDITNIVTALEDRIEKMNDKNECAELKSILNLFLDDKNDNIRR